jgi:DNA-binding FadR family transcriptional regulator
MATRAACIRMTARHLKALQDSVGQACCLPTTFAWDRKAAAHVQIFNLLADVAADHPIPAMLLNGAVGAVYDLMVEAGPGADGIITGSRNRLLALIRAGDGEGAAAEIKRHLRALRFMAQLPNSSAPDGIAV